MPSDVAPVCHGKKGVGHDPVEMYPTSDADGNAYRCSMCRNCVQLGAGGVRPRQCPACPEWFRSEVAEVAWEQFLWHLKNEHKEFYERLAAELQR